MKFKKTHKIVKVIALKNFEILCHFENGIIKKLNLKKYLKSGPVFLPLKKQSFFNKVFLESGIPTWPNGFDVCPDFIYMNAEIMIEKSAIKKSA